MPSPPVQPDQPEQPGYGPAAYQPPRPTSGKANTVMILGIIGLATFVTFCGLGVFAAIATLVLAPGARREIAASGGQLEGEGKVRLGVILAWITVGLTALAIVLVVAVIAIASTSATGSSGVSGAAAGVTSLTGG